MLYDVIGALGSAFAGLDQTLRQTSRRLVELAALADARQASGGDARWPEQDSPRDTAQAAAVNLESARGPLTQATLALTAAQVWAGRLYLETPEG